VLLAIAAQAALALLNLDFGLSMAIVATLFVGFFAGFFFFAAVPFGLRGAAFTPFQAASGSASRSSTYAVGRL